MIRTIRVEGPVYVATLRRGFDILMTSWPMVRPDGRAATPRPDMATDEDRREVALTSEEVDALVEAEGRCV